MNSYNDETKNLPQVGDTSNKGGAFGVGNSANNFVPNTTIPGTTVTDAQKTRAFFNPSATDKLNEMIDNMNRAATTRIGAPNQVQASLMNDALSAQLGVAGITGEAGRGVYEKAKIETAAAANAYKDNAATVAKQMTPTTPTPATSAVTNYDEAIKAAKKIKLGKISTDTVGG